MKRFATGLLAGSIIGAIGVGMAMTDAKSRRRMKKQAVRKANELMDNVHDMF
ncbi:MAG: YtxH domain-containing protein [Firmicutes bacterium]|nr:YtxH domain-containing protein [Bacillota bacterium]